MFLTRWLHDSTRAAHRSQPCAAPRRFGGTWKPRFHRWHSRLSPTRERICAAANPSAAPFQGTYRGGLRTPRRGPIAFGFGLFFLGRDWSRGKQVLFQLLVEGRIPTADPFQNHCGMLLFFIAI